jgi:cell division septation protein DedD
MRKTKKKKRRYTRQSSLAKNMALLFLSLGLLGAVSFVFSYFSTHADLSLDPIQSAWNGIFSPEEKPQAKAQEPDAKKSSVAPIDYSFYEILNKKQEPAHADTSYTIQVGAFKNKEHAVTLARELKEKSRLSFRVEKEGKLSCIRWGSFTTLDKAEKYREKLSAKLQRECKVVKM